MGWGEGKPEKCKSLTVGSGPLCVWSQVQAVAAQQCRHAVGLCGVFAYHHHSLIYIPPREGVGGVCAKGSYKKKGRIGR